MRSSTKSFPATTSLSSCAVYARRRGSERAAEREKLLAARLIAVSIFVHTHSEAPTSSSLFLYEPDLTVHIAEQLALDRGVLSWSKPLPSLLSMLLRPTALASWMFLRLSMLPLIVR